MGHPDFRVNGRIFATLGAPTQEHGMLKLSPEHQQVYLRSHPRVFVPVNGAWGRQGCTNIVLAAASAIEIRAALAEAWYLATQHRPSRKKKKA